MHSESEEEDIEYDFLALYNLRERVGDTFSGFKEKINDLRGRLSTAKFVRLRDKVAFFVSLNWLIFAFYILGAAPDYFHVFYTIFFWFLVGCRYVMYKAKNWHYYLLEFCYYGNFVM
jgi:hypothetical protein